MKSVLGKLNTNLYLLLVNFAILVSAFFTSKRVDSYIYMVIPIIIINLGLLEYKSKKYKYTKKYSCYVFENNKDLVFVNCIQIYLIECIACVYLFLTDSLSLIGSIILVAVFVLNMVLMLNTRRKGNE